MMLALISSYRTTLKGSTSQLMFGRDDMLNAKFDADWNFIKNNKQYIQVN
jgi:hypothetical protein